jgi:hypothetical protein
MTMDTLTTAGAEFARRFRNVLCELQLQTGIYRRIEHLINVFGQEHPNLRATYISREVDESYFTGYPVDVLARPRLQGIAVEGDCMYEFVAFHHGFRADVLELRSISHIQETWLEPKPEEPFVLRVQIYHDVAAATILLATNGEGQDAVQEFIARIKYLRGW